MDKRLLLGVDIGGTKCAVTLGESENDGITIRDKEDFETTGVNETIAGIKAAIWEVLKRNAVSNKEIDAIGVSCGGPLDSKAGVIMSPPNLPGWDNIPIVGLLAGEFGVPVAVHNDANACALAEWTFLTLAMIHPTCLHLCTKLLSKARKGDAIHPEKSALFTIY